MQSRQQPSPLAKLAAVSSLLLITACSSNSPSADTSSSTASGTQAAQSTGISEWGQPRPTTISDPNAVCVAELLPAMGSFAQDSQGGNHTITIATVIGTKTPLFQMATDMGRTFFMSQIQKGRSAALADAQAAAPGVCASAGNPVLTEVQVQGLEQVVASGDASDLAQVSYFGAGVGSSAGATPSAAQLPAPTDARGACSVEAAVAVDLQITNPEELITTLGARSPIRGIALDLERVYHSALFNDGSPSAYEKAYAKAPAACDSASDPVLTSSQVADLSVSSVPANDKAALASVTFFGSPLPASQPATASVALPSESVPVANPTPESVDPASTEAALPSNTGRTSNPVAVTTSTVVAAPDAQTDRDPSVDGPVSAGRPMAAAPYLVPNPVVVVYAFTTPTGNITCNLSPSDPNLGPNVSCDIATHTYPTPVMPPAFCVGEYGLRMGVNPLAGPLVECRSDPLSKATTVLNYGQSITVGAVSCLSTKSGVRCELSNDRGFIISKAELVVIN